MMLIDAIDIVRQFLLHFTTYIYMYMAVDFCKVYRVTDEALIAETAV